MQIWEKCTQPRPSHPWLSAVSRGSAGRRGSAADVLFSQTQISQFHNKSLTSSLSFLSPSSSHSFHSWHLELLRALFHVCMLVPQIITQQYASPSCTCRWCMYQLMLLSHNIGLSIISWIPSSLGTKRHMVNRRRLNHTDGYNDQWCLTEGDVPNCVCRSLVANKSMPACPQNVKWQPPQGFGRQTRVRLFPKWL